MIRVLGGSRRAAAAVVALVALGAFAGCGSGSSSTTATSGGGNQSDELNTFASSIQSGKSSTFKAEYTFSGAGSNGMITIEQKPPKTRFESSAGVVIGTGTATSYCSTGATPTCLSAGTSNPMAGITQLFNPDNVITAIQSAKEQVAAHLQGYNVTFSTQTFAGVDANCVTVSGQGTGKYCVTKSGILAYAGTPGANFSLTSFTTNVSDSAFALPAGASTQTIPGG